MRRDSESFPTWTSTWLRTMTKARLDWDTGRLSTDGLADVIAAELGCTAEAVRGYMSELCRRLTSIPQSMPRCAGGGPVEDVRRS